MGMSKSDILVDSINFELDKLVKDQESNLKITKWVNELSCLADKGIELEQQKEALLAQVEELRDALTDMMGKSNKTAYIRAMKVLKNYQPTE